MPERKRNVADLLSTTTPSRPNIRRGPGYHLSTEEENSSSGTDAQSGNLENQKSTKASQTSSVPRSKLGYAIRDDLIKGIRRIAVDEDRFVYEVMEEALEAYLAARSPKQEGR